MANRKRWKIAAWLAGIAAAVAAFEPASEVLSTLVVLPREDLLRVGFLAVMLLLWIVPASYLIATGKAVARDGRVRMNPRRVLGVWLLLLPVALFLSLLVKLRLPGATVLIALASPLVGLLIGARGRLGWKLTCAGTLLPVLLVTAPAIASLFAREILGRLATPSHALAGLPNMETETPGFAVDGSEGLAGNAGVPGGGARSRERG